MRYLISYSILIWTWWGQAHAQVVPPKFDSLFKIGKVGYRVDCKNKNPEDNELTVKPVGFESTARPMTFYIKGRVVGGEIDDLNNDGYPDMVLYVSAGPDGIYGSVYAFASQENKSVTAFALQDVQLNGKISQGYKGHDKFYLMEGSLMQKFPIYKPGDDKDKPTGGNRVIQYQMANADNGRYKFELLRFYDTH
jgi:hypothetical protein